MGAGRTALGLVSGGRFRPAATAFTGLDRNSSGSTCAATGSTPRDETPASSARCSSSSLSSTEPSGQDPPEGQP